MISLRQVVRMLFQEFASISGNQITSAIVAKRYDVRLLGDQFRINLLVKIGQHTPMNRGMLVMTRRAS